MCQDERVNPTPNPQPPTPNPQPPTPNPQPPSNFPTLHPQPHSEGRDSSRTDASYETQTPIHSPRQTEVVEGYAVLEGRWQSGEHGGVWVGGMGWGVK
jgi:hypothetical protein